MNPLGNWWFGIGIAVLFTGLGWIVTERIVAPRLGAWHGDGPAASERQAAQLTTAERRGLRAAGLAALGVAALFAALSLWPGFTPLYDEAAAPGQRLTPLFRALAPGFLLLFLATGWAYGAVAGTVRSHRDVVAMMAKGLEGMLPYLVLVFFAAQFVAMFGWSNLGPITAIVGADQLRAMHAPPALLLPMLTTMSAWLDFLIASGSAKWTAMAPVAAPMMMLLGISPEMTTAAYRVGDTVTNLISPLNPYFVLTLTFCRRWIPDFRLGSLLALLLPLSIAFFLGGAALTAIWVALEIPVGPGAAVSYTLPAPVRSRISHTTALPEAPMGRWSKPGSALFNLVQPGSISAQTKTGVDLWVLPMTGERKPLAVVQTAMDQPGGEFSPDGRWLASRIQRVGAIRRVRATVPGGGGQVADESAGGTQPRWRRDGKELYTWRPMRA